ncbi:MAG: hypothetical protein C5B45_06480 [Chlamydiae bacterium]|nr:MAG: hypothetical protein C5B45_06480 [Chlamydiota bacterium]
MPVQNSLIPTTVMLPVDATSTRPVTIPIDLLSDLIENGYNLKRRIETAEEKIEVKDRRIEVLEAENIELKNDNTRLKDKEIKKETFIQLTEEGLQSSKRVLQYVCAISGAILGGGFVLACPAAAGVAVALVGTGPTVAGVALVGGATGGCLVAPAIHEKTQKALVQQLQNFKAKEEISKEAQ